jgi:hypothetical protein
MKIDKFGMFCLVLFVIAIALVLFKKCGGTRVDDGVKPVQPRIDTIYNKDSIRVYQQQIVEIKAANARELRRYSDSIFNLRKKYNGVVRQLSQVKQAVVVSGIKIPLKEDTAARDSTTPMSVSRKIFEFDSASLKIRGVVWRDTIEIKSIELENTLSQRIITRRSGFLGLRRTVVVQAMNSSPYFYNTNMQTTTVKPTPTAWNRWIKPALALGAGFILAKQL